MTHYQEAIMEATGAILADVKTIEELMRLENDGCLDALSAKQFSAEAKQAYDTVLWMKTPEGVAYLEQIDNEIFA